MEENRRILDTTSAQFRKAYIFHKPNEKGTDTIDEMRYESHAFTVEFHLKSSFLLQYAINPNWSTLFSLPQTRPLSIFLKLVCSRLASLFIIYLIAMTAGFATSPNNGGSRLYIV
jgi:hypothetical protein